MVNLDNIPEELKSISNWTLWKFSNESGKRKKIPLSANDGKGAKINDPKTFGTFNSCVHKLEMNKSWFDGLNFAFKPNCGYLMIDIDKCFDNGCLLPEVEEIVYKLKSYTETSYSKKGLHIFLKSGDVSIENRMNKNGNFEIYDNHFCSVTGDIYKYERIIQNDEFLIWYLDKYHPIKEVKKVVIPQDNPIILSDNEIIMKIRSAKNAKKFDKLFNGDYTGYKSISEAIMAFCGMLAFYSKDSAKIDRIFRSSALYPGYEKKWEKVGAKTIDKAISNPVSYEKKLCYCKKCNMPIFFFNDVIGKNGRKIPCDAEKNRHKCKKIVDVKSNDSQVQNLDSRTVYDCLFEGKLIHSLVVEVLYNKFNQNGLISAEQYLWQYNKGYWKKMDKVIVQKTIQNFLGGYAKMSVITDIYEQLLIYAHPGKNDFEFNKNKSLICLNNVTLNTETMQILPHSKDHYLNFKVDTTYGRTTSCPTWKQYLENTGLMKETIMCLQEYFGYCFTSRTRELELFLLFYGDGGDGKSTFIETLRGIIGSESSCTIEPRALLGTGYDLADLQGKLVNLCGEIETRYVFNSKFNGIVTGDKVRSRRIHKDPFEFVPIAKHIFSCNKLPALNERTYGVYRRISIVHFKRSFTRDYKHLQIKNLAEKLKSEYDGIFSWAMDGLKRLMENNFKITESPEMVFSKKEFEKESNDIHLCIEEMIDRIIQNSVPKNGGYCIKSCDLRTIYVDWCEKNGVSKLKEINFGREFLSTFRTAKKERFVFDMKRSYCYWIPEELAKELAGETNDLAIISENISQNSIANEGNNVIKLIQNKQDDFVNNEKFSNNIVLTDNEKLELNKMSEIDQRLFLERKRLGL